MLRARPKDMAEESDFWVAYRQLADCYRADLGRLGGATPKKEEGRGTEEEIAREKGHRLQRVLLARVGFLAREAFLAVQCLF